MDKIRVEKNKMGEEYTVAMETKKAELLRPVCTCARVCECVCVMKTTLH